MRQPSPIFKGKIGNGKIWLECRADFAVLIQKLEGLDVEVILRKLRRKRSLKQNAYYWAVIVPMFQEAVPFDTPDEATRSAQDAVPHRPNQAVADHKEHHEPEHGRGKGRTSRVAATCTVACSMPRFQTLCARPRSGSR